MHISYKPLWHTLVERNMRKEDLRIAAGLTTNMIANMGKGKNISMETLVRICEALNCGILDVIELEQDKDAEKWTIEKELSDFGLICGLQKKIWVYLMYFLIMPYILKVGGQSTTAPRK